MTQSGTTPPEGEWSLVVLGEPGAGAGARAGDETGAAPGGVGAEAVPSLVLAGGLATGTGGVNRFRGTYEAPGEGDLRLSPLLSTRMAGPPAANALETAYLDALARVARFELVTDPSGPGGDRLLLRDGSGAVLVVLRRDR
ncbi:META domain-containing protein [Jannaschia sp. R86511]|uniref:META domain-containing protein n=1 Tax=Jannaschia sp. R86511 TaxID=3093853 RepID=UPI0036D3714E